MKMEELGRKYRPALSKTWASWDADQERLRVIDGRDRMQLLWTVST